MEKGVPAGLPDGPPASLVVGPVAVHAEHLSHNTHHDLRYSFSPVASVESASGEALRPAQVVQTGNAGAAGPVVLCPGRVRYFNI